MANVDISGVFGKEPKEIVKYFESKGLKTSYDWHDIYEDAHAKAFTVAKMTQADLLADTHKMLTTAIKEGWSEGKFVKNASEMFEKKGWTGKKEVTNPKTGEVETVELGTSRRIKTIFRCNMSSAYSVGRYKQQLEDADVAPYFQYCAVMDGRTRPAHQAMNGKIFRYDDPIWNTMYPPNGWNCRCTVVSLTPGMVKRKGLTVESSEGRLTETTETVGDTEKPNTSYRFDRNGLVYDLKPDAGWGTNQALNSNYLDTQFYDKIKSFSYGMKAPLIKELNENEVSINKVRRTVEKGIKQVAEQTFRPDKQPATLAWLTPEILKFIEKEKLLNVGGVIKITDADIIHLMRTNKNVKQKLTTEQIRRMPINFRKPTAVFYDVVDSALIYIQKLPENEIIDGKDIIKFVVKPTKTTWQLRTAGKANLYKDIIKQERYKKM